MGLPDLIEIIPLTKPVQAEITVPGSKSITNRALILAALAEGTVTLQGALWSEDTQVMVECLEKLGFEIEVKPDPNEFCNRTIRVKGLGGKIPKAGTPGKPLELFVGNAGTAARFLSAFVCLGNGVYRLSGVPRMHERPQAALFQALRELGYSVEAENKNDKLPVIVSGRSRGNDISEKKEGGDLLTSCPPKKCRVSIEESSQFASALFLCAKVGNWEIEVVGENAEESPYVAMTAKMIEAFPKAGGNFQIEPDASSGSYFWASGMVAPGENVEDGEISKTFAARLTSIFMRYKEARVAMVNSGGHGLPFWRTLQDITKKYDLELFDKLEELRSKNSQVSVCRWPLTQWQIDTGFIHYQSLVRSWGNESSEISRKNDLGDSIMTAVIVQVLANKESKFTDLGRLRLQECERVVALRTELTKCGAKVIEAGDTLTVYPSPLHGAEIETYHDHRMAMCFAVLGLKVPGIRIRNPCCVKKTFPNFFQKLAAEPPHGLGVEIWEIKDGERVRPLSGDDLFAD